MIARPGFRMALAAGAAALLLAGCEAQPIGTFDAPRVTFDGAEAQRDLYFRPGTPGLLPGQAEGLNAFLRDLVLRPQDDVIVTLGATGSDRLDTARVAEVRRTIASGPARVRVVGPSGFARAPDRPDIALVQVRRYDRVRVACPGSGRTNENPALLTPIPVTGCANTANIAEMAAENRDLIAPRELRGSDAIQGVRAIARYRAGDVTIAPLETTTN